MPVLKSLSITTMPKTASDPVHIRRAKFIEKLEEQKLLLQDPAYIRTVQRMAEVDGQKQAVVRKQRVKPWWKNISVAAPFVWRCLNGPTMAPFPHPAHR
jgi:hypothetical protein